MEPSASPVPMTRPAVGGLAGSSRSVSAVASTPLIRLALIEDDPDQRRWVREQVAVHADLQVVGVFASGGDAMERLGHTRPDVVLVDIGLPDHSGIEVVAHWKPRMPRTQFMMLTVIEDVAKVYAALSAGATGYLLKKDIPSRLYEAVRELWGGGSPMTGSIARKVVSAFCGREGGSFGSVPGGGVAEASDGGTGLTPRERQILDLLAAGRLYKEIADALGIGMGTVNTHIRHIYEKLHAHNRSEAVRLAGGR